MFRGDSQAPRALILNHERGREAHSCTADTSTRARSSFSLDTSERFSISLFKGLSNSFEQNSFFSYALLGIHFSGDRIYY